MTRHIRDVLRQIDWSASLADDSQQCAQGDDADLDEQNDPLCGVHDDGSTQP